MTSDAKTNVKKGTLSFIDRIKEVFKQDESNLILHRLGQTQRYKISDFFALPERRKQLQFFDEAAAFCEIIYQGGCRVFNSKGGILVKNNSLDVSSAWHEMEQLPYLESWQRRLINFDKSLKIQVWLNKKDKKVMIVFRGTSYAKEWFVNLRWITLMPFRALISLLTGTKFNTLGFIWDHYDIVQAYIPILIAEIKEQLPIEQVDDFEFISAGHSLGGGLAQQTAYCSPDIKKVFAFHSSPVTGYFCVPHTARQINKQGVHIIRAHEKGEILAFFRFPARVFSPLTRLVMSDKDPLIEELRFNFMQQEHSIEEHNMAPFRHDLEAILQSHQLKNAN